MRLQEEDERPAAMVDAMPLPPTLNPFTAVARFVSKTLVIAEMEARKLRHDFTELILRAIQPALWLLLFGQVLNRVREIPTGGLRYIDFIAPGILAQSGLFVAIFYGISLIWERDLGITNKLLVSPTPRAALVSGKALSAGIRALSQALVIYTLALLLGVGINWHPLALIGVLTIVVINASLFSSFSLIVASLVKTRERFMGIGQLIMLPLFFASNALYPVALMPNWLRVISHINPLSYTVDALRALMLKGGVSNFGLGMDFCVLLAVTFMLVIICARLYPRVIV